MQTTSKLLMFSFYISDFGLLAFILLKFTRSVIAMHCALPFYYPWGNAHLLTSSHHLLTKNPYGVITERIRLGLPCSGQQNESNLANIYHWVSLITHTNVMQEWSGFCPHRKWLFICINMPFLLEILFLLRWLRAVCLMMSGVLLAVMDCVPDGLSVRTTCGWWPWHWELY